FLLTVEDFLTDDAFPDRFQTRRATPPLERKASSFPVSRITSVFSRARTKAFSILFWLGSHSMRVRKICSIATLLFERSLTVAEKLLQPADPVNFCASLRSSGLRALSNEISTPRWRIQVADLPSALSAFIEANAKKTMAMTAT